MSALLLSAMAACQSETDVGPTLPSPWIGYWQFQSYPGANERQYTSVPDDSGLTVIEKNQMLEFRADGFLRAFFWNRCATPPVIPTGWIDGTWAVQSTDPLRLDLTLDGETRTVEVVAVDGTTLILRFTE